MSVHDLLNDNFILASPVGRIISNFNFVNSTDPSVTSLFIDTQYESGDIYTILTEICFKEGIGFKITLNEETKNFDFILYNGKNRTSSQLVNNPVKFSNNLENLLSTTYIKSKRFKKTVVLVSGEKGVGNIATETLVYSPEGPLTGLSRKEIHYKASIGRNSIAGELNEADYIAQLEAKGQEVLAQNAIIESFDGDVDTTMYSYGTAFDMGDIVEIEDSYGHNKEVRVTEMIYSQDKEGIKMYPLFDSV